MEKELERIKSIGGGGCDYTVGTVIQVREDGGLDGVVGRF